MRISDWSSDVCSSDLGVHREPLVVDHAGGRDLELLLHPEHLLRLADLPAGDERQRRRPVLLVAHRGARIDPRDRSEERRAGKECVSPCRSRWRPENYNKNTNRYNTRRPTIITN